MSNSEELEKELLGRTLPKKPNTRWDRFIGVAIIVLFFGVFGGWAVISPLESAAVTNGKVIVAGYRKLVQHYEGGIVKQIFVKDGSKVKKGQPLIQLDNTQAKVALDVVQNEFIQLTMTAARIRAELDLEKDFTLPKVLEKYKENPKVEEQFKSQSKIYRTNTAAYDTQVKILQQRILQLDEQKKGEHAQLVALTRQQQLIVSELREVKVLFKKRLIERSRLMSLLREESRLEGQRGAKIGAIATINQRVGETQNQIISVKNSRHSELLDELKETNTKLAEVTEREKVAEHVLERTTIRAPQTGTVVALEVHTIGRVIKPGETLMEIVPKEQRLLIETEVGLQDIDVVKTGLTAKVQLTALQTRTTPALLGKVVHVSADTYEEPRSGKTYYRAIVEIYPKELKKLGDQKLYPGMPAQVMIITQKLTPFEYFTNPIKRSFGRAFREQ